MTSAFNEIVPDQQPEKLIGDLQFTEGPVWHPDGYLLFSDIPANRIIKYAPDGAVDTYLQPSRNSNGLTFDHDLRLVACEHTGRQVSRQADDGQMETVVSHWDSKRLNSPNDLVVHSSGSIFFTDPPYGIQPEEAEIGFNGVYRSGPQRRRSRCSRRISGVRTGWRSRRTSRSCTSMTPNGATCERSA